MNNKGLPRYLSLFFGCFLLLNLSLSHTAVLNISSGIREPLSNIQHTGFNDQITREAFRRIGIEINIIQLPAKRALRDLNDGVIDGDLVRIADIQQVFPNIYPVPEKIIDFEFVVISKNKNYTPDKAWDSLKPYEVGIVAGWKILEVNVKNTLGRTKVQDTAKLMHILAKDRVDMVVSERWQALQALKELGRNDLYINKPLLKKREMFLVVNKKHQDLIPQLAQAIKAMKKDGTFAKIYNQTLGALIKP